jgi:hypothetical protein
MGFWSPSVPFRKLLLFDLAFFKSNCIYVHPSCNFLSVFVSFTWT